jgi:hypothetical protein
MKYCTVCDEIKDEVGKCVTCGDDVCTNCLVERTPFNLVDANYCKSCELINGWEERE